MKKNILVVEDNEKHMGRICNIIDELGSLVNVFKATNLKDALYFASTKNIHLFLIDIILDSTKPDNVDGLNFVSDLRNNIKYKFTPIIFLTSLEDPKLHAYSDLHCFSYVEKPFDDKYVKKLISEALQYPVDNNKSNTLYFRNDGIVYSVKSDEIVLIESSQRVMKIYSINDCLKVSYKSIPDVLELLNANDFLQCSRTAVVNRNYIKQVDFSNRFIKLDYIDRDVEIGINWKKRFREKLECD